MRNVHFNPRGSDWRKWDLHVHTPLSIEQGYGGANEWEKYFDDLRALPAEIEVLGINDYLFLDGYWRVKEEWKAGRLPNLKLLLPVVELRIDKFGGVGNQLSRANFHIIFSNEVDSEIESQFLHSLGTTGYQLGDYRWDSRPTRDAVEVLGREIKARTPDGVAPPNGSDLKVGHNNVNITIQTVRSALKNSVFRGKALTGVGLSEWNAIRWEGSTAEKKSLIERCNFVFTASPSVEQYHQSKQNLADNDVNSRLIHASDAHYYSDSERDNRLGNTYTWIKSDPTFEGLKQALFEFESRIKISENHPVYPVNQIEKVSLNFPDDSSLSSDGASDNFCFSGRHEFTFSPYFTAIIGGRGTGKSTLLNLIDERIRPRQNKYFQWRNITPETVNITESVQIEGITDPSIIEFLEQNEIERFAVDYKEFTKAIYQRIYKLDNEGLFSTLEARVREVREKYDQYDNARSELYQKTERKKVLDSKLASQQSIVQSFNDAEYVRLNEELNALTGERQRIQVGITRLNTIVDQLKELLIRQSEIDIAEELKTEADKAFTGLTIGIKDLLDQVSRNEGVQTENTQLTELAVQISIKRGEIEQFLSERGHSPENMKDISGASEQIALIRSELSELESTNQNLTVSVSELPFDRTLVSDFKDQIEAALEPINEKLVVQNPQVKNIRIDFEFDESFFNEQIFAYIHSEINKVESYRVRDDYLRNIFSGFDFKEVNGVQNLLTELDGETTTTAQYIRDYFSSAVNFHDLKMKIEFELLELRKYGRFNVQYDERPLENNSFGQRCTATLVILLLLGNNPIIIDEPEAHLDSKLIAEYLVDLIKSKKFERQIIFATHNANFVINGDADLIHCLKIDEETKRTMSDSITIEIEDEEGREKLLALEGGEEAFQRREDRYGLSLS